MSSVSIICAARNNGPFLREALESAVKQSAPCEVIYVDDSSIDDSLSVARSIPGVRVIPLDRHSGVCAARNAGAAASRGEFLIHLDGDDKLTPTFAADHLSAMAPGVPFVYGPAQAFGDISHFWDVPGWAQSDIWRCNFCNTSSMYRRDAFERAGRWRDDPITMWDWDLALRAVRLGPPRPSRAALLYRQHAASWAHQLQEHLDTHRAGMMPHVRRINARLSVGAIVSGRVRGLFPRWLSQLAASVRLLRTPHPATLVILDNSQDPEFRALMLHELGRYAERVNTSLTGWSGAGSSGGTRYSSGSSREPLAAATFAEARIIDFPGRLQWSTEQERRDRVASFMAAASNRLRAELPGDLHWIVEDDVMVPLSAAESLFHAATAGFDPPHAVAGCYRNRHVPESYVGGWRRNGWQEIRELTGPDPIPVDFTGTGCLMYWRDRTPNHWYSHFEGIAAHDWAWGMALQARGGKLLMLPAVRCGHAVSETEIIPG